MPACSNWECLKWKVEQKKEKDMEWLIITIYTLTNFSNICNYFFTFEMTPLKNFFCLVSYFGTRWLKEKLGNICSNSKYLSFCFEFFWVTVSNIKIWKLIVFCQLFFLLWMFLLCLIFKWWTKTQRRIVNSHLVTKRQ